MFKVGDKVVCIKINEYDVDSLLTIYRVYTIRYVDNLFGIHYIGVQYESSIHLQCDADNFLSIKEYRKQKINKVMSLL